MKNLRFYRSFASSASSKLIKPEVLKKVCEDILIQSGSSAKEASIVASNLVESNLKGHDSHGVGYLPRYIRAAMDKEININAKPDIVIENNFVKVDGKVCYGQVVGLEAMDVGISVAKKYGMSIVALKNSHHLGRIGAWAEQVIQHNLVSIHFTNVAGHAPLVACENGGDARLGTNPITMGFPSNMTNNGVTEKSAPIVLDFATSDLALGKVRETWARGEKTRDNVLLDSNGNPTNDPSVMFQNPAGALLPFCGHKGYAMALMCEMIGGVLSGGNTIHPKYPRHNERILNSMTTIIFDPSKLNSNLSGIDDEVNDVKNYMRNSPIRSASSSKQIFIPGELEMITYEDRIANGIPVAKGTWEDLVNVAKEIGLDSISDCS
jgi:hydroxycarboxylate dehydrogenase B